MKEPSSSVQQALPPEILESLRLHLASLESQLLATDPKMKEHLASSHRLLISYPETVHLLEDHEIALVIKRQEEFSNQRIVADTAAGKTKGKRTINAAEDL